MKKLSKFALLALIAGMMISSCKKESVDPSATSLSLKIQATNKSFSLLKSSAVSTPGLVADTCYMVISKIEFEAENHKSEKSHDSTEVHLEWKGPKKADLFSLTSVIGEINLQPGVFDEISIKIKAFKADAGSSPVFYLAGSFKNSADSVIPIKLIINEDFEFRVKAAGSSIDGTGDYTSLIKLNLNLLMEGIDASDLQSATRTNGKIILNNSSNVSLYNLVKKNLSSCGETEFEHGKEHDSGIDSKKDNSGLDDGYGY